MDFMNESDVNQLWKLLNVVEKLDVQNKGNKKFNFYDGPPFASGNPHYGHLLAGTIKDVIVRYHLLNGEDVRRVWGWDTHGVPIESKANKELNIQYKDDILKMGIDKYNQECRKYVMSCQQKWKNVVNKLGRWIDMESAYKTMDPSFMNSVWYVFSELYKKGLIYHGVKIMSYSPVLGCPLSNNEANLNYIDVSDPSLTVTFPIKYKDIDVNVLVWTTTPWTLPCNMLLCVHPNLEYSMIECNGKNYLLLSNLTKKYFKKFTVLETVIGKDLVGIKYEPLFTFYLDFKPAKDTSLPFCIVSDTMVSADSGTGVVHIAPGFGQDDMNVAMNYGLISDDVLPPCPLDDMCVYISPVNQMDIMKDRFCKDCDPDIIKYLKSIDRVFKVDKIHHSYPHCYRTDCPLIYRTYPAWFIRVKENKERIKNNLMKTNWVPNYIRDNKYMQSLECVVDWCISRNRFWGTPIPLWTNGDETIVVESAKHLEELTSKEPGSINDLHPEFIFEIQIPSKNGGKPLKNVGLVLDCWFESGSMPFGQWGYPYNDTVKFNDIFPADFIAEGTDQTRGWFHAMMTLYTLLVDEPPFKNVIVNGIVQSKVPSNENKSGFAWAKMSKKYGNYDDPEDVIDTYGADTLRLFFVQSAGVHAGDVPFDIATFKTIKKNYSVMMQNMVSFWHQSVIIYNHIYNEAVQFVQIEQIKDLSSIDVWIVQEMNQFIAKMSYDYSTYELCHLTDHIDKIVDKISRWYIKLNKKTLKGENQKELFQTSINILTYCLHYLFLMMAPITPFMSEAFYQFMKAQVDNNIIKDYGFFNLESIHLHRMVNKLNVEIDSNVNYVDGMNLFVQVIEMTRQYRSIQNKPLKMPINEIIISHDDKDAVNQLSNLTYYLRQELNSDNIHFNTYTQNYVDLKYKPDRKTFGIKFGKKSKEIIAFYEETILTYYMFEANPVITFTCASGDKVELVKSDFTEYAEIKPYINFDSTKPFNTNDETFNLFVDKFKNKIVKYENGLVMVFDTTVTNDMENNYYVNCVAREINEMRKEANLNPTNNIHITFMPDETAFAIIKSPRYSTRLKNLIGHEIYLYNAETDSKPFLASERTIADKYKLTLNFHYL
jgi:isoleucyl-tRNA synthetase